MVCTDTTFIPDLSVNIFSVTRALTNGFNLTSEKESLAFKKIPTVLKLEERLDYGNGNSCLLAARIYASPNGARKHNWKR